MSGFRRLRASFACVPVLLGVSLAASSAAPGPGDLARCATIAAPDQRLACYDLLAGRPPDRTAPALSAPPPAAAAAPATAPAAPAPDDPRNFGLNAAQLHPTPPAATSAVQAHITQIIQSATGFGRPILVLDNGQTWIFTEAPDDSRLGSGDPVSIKRAALGSFMLTTPSHHSYHVHRLQ